MFEAAPPDLWNNYLDVIRQRRDALLAHLAQPRSMNAIVEVWIAYKRPREPQAFDRQAEPLLITKHPEELMNEGRGVLVVEKYRRT